MDGGDYPQIELFEGNRLYWIVAFAAFLGAWCAVCYCMTIYERRQRNWTADILATIADIDRKRRDVPNSQQ
jgi:hypothetical protein